MKKIVLIILFLSVTLFGQQKGFHADKKEHDLTCGLQPYKYPRWTSEIELSNGKKLHFVSVKCMMLFYYKNSKWHDLGVKGKEDIKTLKVQDYESLHVVNAKDGFYVFGSKITSPKGDDLIPFSTKKEAEDFMKKSGGSKILRYKDFKVNLFDYLNL